MKVRRVVPAMSVRYRCVFIDHDDTAVDSTASIHYPAHIEALRVLRPGRTPPTMDKWLLANFHGIMEYLVEELGMTEAELKTEFEIWRGWTTSQVPNFYSGFLPLMAEFHAQGGLVAVISHSEADVIESHYMAATVPRGIPGARKPPFLPDLIFGWEHDESRRKPSPWPVQEALRRFGCAPFEALIVDDLKPGVLMSQASGVDIAAAGWSHRVPEIEKFMRANTKFYCAQVDDLGSLILDGRGKVST